jgi:transcriptional regulator GlxA family with amidase domain
MLGDILAKALVENAGRGDERVEQAINLIMSAGGRIDLASLARAVRISTRHLDRCFDRFLGMCPKLLCRIARFRAAWNSGFGSDRANWAMIADRCGYADQAHLCREFQAFAGISPGQTNGLGAGQR